MKSDFPQAINYYTKAIDLIGLDNPKSSVYLCNRSFSHIKMENYGAALEDAESAIKVNP